MKDWSYLAGASSVPRTTDITIAPETDRARIPYVCSSDSDPERRPVTTWDVTGDVQVWYCDPDTNLSFALVSEDDGHHLDDTPFDN